MVSILNKVTFAAIVSFLSVGCLFAQPEPPCAKTILETLEQTAQLLNKKTSVDLWRVQLNAPVVIVNPAENKMYFTAIANGKVEPLKEEAWDNKVPLANSFYEYNGKKYVTIIENALQYAPCNDRVNLLAHEIFHLHQNSLGINNTASNNFHIDGVSGRALLQIEMAALQKALTGDMQSLYNALYVRKYRQSLSTDNNEDMYELNEGLANYTGIKLAIPDPRTEVTDALNYTISRGYANAFAYATGAAYALILDSISPAWRYDTDLLKGLPYLFAKHDKKYDITVTDDYVNRLLADNNFDAILAKEQEELKSFGDVDAFRSLLLPETSKVFIPNNGVNFTYNPNDRIISLNDAVLLRNLTLKGEWGSAKITSGIVRLNNWSAFYLLPPTEVNGNNAKGDNYEISLNDGWKLVEEENTWQIVSE